MLIDVQFSYSSTERVMDVLQYLPVSILYTCCLCPLAIITDSIFDLLSEKLPQSEFQCSQSFRCQDTA